MTRKEKIRCVVLVVFLLPTIGLAAWCGYNIFQLSHERAQLKSDYAEVNNIENGLLSVDRWRDNITAIVTEQIEEFDFSIEQKDTIKKQINNILNSLVTQAEDMIMEKQKTVSGKLTKFAVRTFVNTDKVRERIPEFSETIINEVKKPSSKQRLKFLAKDKLSDFASQTKDSIQACSAIDSIYMKYGSSDPTDFNQLIARRIDNLQQKTYNYSFVMIGIVIFFLFVWSVIRKQNALHTPMFTMSVLLALVVLLVGLASPMIEIDARIKQLNFILIGKQIVFTDQVIFFQSKSILDVVTILIKTYKADSMLVGVLILVFSVVFPIAKLLSTKAYLLGNDKWKGNSLIRFFAFKSGKWSMADVMVVAIFMSYIGFKGILDSQLEDLTFETKSLSSIATNETSLQPGFILFVCFVLFSLVLSVILKKITALKAGIQTSRAFDKDI